MRSFWVFVTVWGLALLLAASYVDASQAESVPAAHTTGHYQMAQGEVYELRCDENPDGIQPAVNLYLVDGEWRIIVACPQVTVFDK